MDFSNVDWADIAQATLDTLTMTGVSLISTVLLGLPLGVLLFLTARGQLLEQRAVYGVLSLIVNVLRSLPFIILLSQLPVQHLPVTLQNEYHVVFACPFRMT